MRLVRSLTARTYTYLHTFKATGATLFASLLACLLALLLDLSDGSTQTVSDSLRQQWQPLWRCLPWLTGSASKLFHFHTVAHMTTAAKNLCSLARLVWLAVLSKVANGRIGSKVGR